MEGELGISRYTAADAGATATSKQPSQLWRWSPTFMWSASRVRFKKKKKNDREKEKENPILCGIEMEWMDFLGESS